MTCARRLCSGLHAVRVAFGQCMDSSSRVSGALYTKQIPSRFNSDSALQCDPAPENSKPTLIPLAFGRPRCRGFESRLSRQSTTVYVEFGRLRNSSPVTSRRLCCGRPHPLDRQPECRTWPERHRRGPRDVSGVVRRRQRFDQSSRWLTIHLAVVTPLAAAAETTNILAARL